MAKVGGQRNFGYGKQMAWAGRQAVQERYGGGHHATMAAHTERWEQFVAWAKEALGLRDARTVDGEVVTAYGRDIAERVSDNGLSAAYAQNLLFTVNVVLEAMRGDRLVRVAPAGVVGQRSHVRTEAPVGLDWSAMRQCADELRAAGHGRVAAVPELARDLGLREREASMLDARAALRDAAVRGAAAGTTSTGGSRSPRPPAKACEGPPPRRAQTGTSSRPTRPGGNRTTMSTTSGRRRGNGTISGSSTICGPPTRASATWR